MTGVSEQDFRAAAARVRNWGRWGDDDELGTLNLVTPAIVAASAASVVHGKVFPLGIAIDEHGPWDGSTYRRNPIHLMTVDGGDSARLLDHLGIQDRPAPSLSESSWGRGLMKFNDDYVVMPLQAASQWDALAHVYYDDLLYNGVPATAVTSAGASRNGIDRVDVKGIASRAVLVDIAAHRGVDHVAAGASVEPEELEQIARRQGIEVREGDILLVRTGWWRQYATLRRAEWRARCPGLSWRCAEWFHALGIAAVAADNLAVEVVDQGTVTPEVILPLHLLCLRDMGLMLGELWYLEDLAADCAADGVYVCHLVAPPLRITGGVGSPVNPIALK